MRKDVDILVEQVWNYCILDEGHIIKIALSRITLAAKRIKAEHRLILSGIPIQNNININLLTSSVKNLVGLDLNYFISKLVSKIIMSCISYKK